MEFLFCCYCLFLFGGCLRMVFEVTVADESFIERMSVFRTVPKGVKLLEGSSLNPVFFASRMLGVTPYSWQVLVMELFRRAVIDRLDYLSSSDEVVSSDSVVKNVVVSVVELLSGDLSLRIDDKEFVIITSRQIGKSTMLAMLSLWVTIFNRVPSGLSNSTSVVIVSASDEQARTLLYEIRKLLLMGDLHMSQYLDDKGVSLFGESYFSDLLSTDDPNNTTNITFKHHSKGLHGDYLLAGSLRGSSIRSYPPTAKVLGSTASVIFVDEAGMYERISDRFFYDYLYPVGNSTNALRAYTSTPWEPIGFFYRMVDPDDVYHNNDDYLVIAFTIEAIKIENPKYYSTVMKTINGLLADGKRDEVSRAYYCRFVKGNSGFFDIEKIPEVFDSDLFMLESFSGVCDLGIDVGGMTNSHTVVTISHYDEDSGVISRLYHRKYPVMDDLSLLPDVADLMKVFNVQRVIIDYAPSSEHLVQKIERDYHWDLVKMSFRKDKISKYNALRDRLHRGLVKSYVDEDLMKEFNGFIYTRGSTQSNIGHAPGYNDDMLDSFLISCFNFLDTDVSNEFFDFNDYSAPDKRIGGVVVDRALERMRKRNNNSLLGGGFFGR